MFDCNKCKNDGTDICCQCSLFNGDKCCTCFQMAPCGYCENILYEDKDMVEYTIDGRAGVFNSILEIDEYRKNNPKANGVVWTHDGYQVNEDHVRQLELKKTREEIQVLQKRISDEWPKIEIRKEHDTKPEKEFKGLHCKSMFYDEFKPEFHPLDVYDYEDHKNKWITEDVCGWGIVILSIFLIIFMLLH